ncbi:hypothetical protein J2Z60_001301 [Lactobacillus colini]|uniref:O-antigen ligase family protein n=1 Tax=Lactobacillus colini TaxID=1819254 RepID=A0ABS4MEQ1_9LACO|nr:hypothetical protein [Lactobacillus colini]
MQKKIQQGLFWFILLQPFLDFYWLNKPPLADILPFSIPTIVRILGIFTLACMYFSQKKSWQLLKQQRWLIIYLLLLLIYSAAHLLHVRNFNSLSPTSYNFSISSEIFYLIRMFLPLAVIYLTKFSDFSERKLIHLIQGLVGIFAGIIVFSNLVIKSLRAYGDGWISYNIIDWFTHNLLSYTLTAAKGFFYFTNTLAAIMFMLAILMLYAMVRNFNWLNVSLFILQGLAMLIMGTKTSTMGFIIALSVGLIIYLCHALILKNIIISKKIVLSLILIAGLYIAALPKSPMVARSKADIAWVQQNKGPYSENHLNKKLTSGLKKTDSKKEHQQYLRNFIEKYYNYYHINPKFITKSYPYQQDPEFWYHIITKYSAEKRLNNRLIEMAMLKQVVKYNHNPLDKWLGISYARTSNIYNLERDFQYQSFSLGCIGVILFLGPYLISELYAIYCWFKNKSARHIINSILISANGFCLIAAYYSGNVMDFLTATIILAFFTGYMIKEINTSRSKKLA